MAKETITAAIGGHSFELRSIQVYEEQFEDMVAFHADIYVDGIATGEVSNNGQCFPGTVIQVSENLEVYKEVEGLVSKRPQYIAGHNGRGYVRSYTIDSLVEAMVSAAYFEGRSAFMI